MALRFTIIDYTNDANGISTQVKEPVGWDGISVRLKRDKTWHGFFDFLMIATATCNGLEKPGTFLRQRMTKME